MLNLVICLIFNLTFEEIATLMMNSIKRTIDGVEKTPTEYKFHLDGDIFAVVNVFKTYRFVHIRHYQRRDISIGWGMLLLKPFCKIIGKNEKEIQANGIFW